MKKNEGKTTDWLSEQSIVFGCYIWFLNFFLSAVTALILM